MMKGAVMSCNMVLWKRKKRSLQAVVTFLEEKQVSLKKAISLAFHRVLDLVVLVKEFE